VLVDHLSLTVDLAEHACRATRARPFGARLRCLHSVEAVGEILECHRLIDDVRGHPVPFERVHETLLRRDLRITALEAVHTVIGVLD
jgi:hypothetical protein